MVFGAPDIDRERFLRAGFADLGDQALQVLNAIANSIEYHEGDLIVQEGAPFSGVFIVYSGLVQIGKYSSADKQRTLRFLAPGEFFGLEVLFMPHHKVNIQFARALLDTTLIFFREHEFNSFIKTTPQFGATLCRWFAREVAMLEFKLTRDTTEGSLHNVALLLSALERKYGKRLSSSSVIELELSRKLMAEMLGISEDTLNNVLKKLRDRKIVSTSNGKLSILDHEALNELSLANEFYLSILKETY